VNIGLGGRREFTTAVRKIAEAVAADELDPASISAAEIESNLVFTDEPDLLIKTGAERLSDFMIWQSVYSELHFTDVNWRDLRLRDYLRAVLDYQNRHRRFGS
jgi:undecaprenyl diphosphate synthase